jgi:hypothetical protein
MAFLDAMVLIQLLPLDSSDLPPSLGESGPVAASPSSWDDRGDGDMLP